MCVSARAIRVNKFPLIYRCSLLYIHCYAPDTRSSVNMTWRYCTCICKLLMFSCSRSVQMLHNVKKNNIDLFEVHVHVSSFQIHVHVQLQISLKCTDACPQIIWSYMHALSEHQTIERKRQVTLIKKVLIILKNTFCHRIIEIYMYMKRVTANICYTHSTEENKMLISFDFYNTNICLNCESH